MSGRGGSSSGRSSGHSSGRGSGRSSGRSGASRYGTTRRYPRTARVNEVIREVLADELERIDDDRLGLLTITGVTADPDLRTATVWLSALMATNGVESLLEAVGEHRHELQAAIGRELRLKRTPLLNFAADPGITNGQRIETILRTMPRSPEPIEADNLADVTDPAVTDLAVTDLAVTDLAVTDLAVTDLETTDADN